MLKIGDRVSMTIMVLVTGGTMCALAMTSAAKKAGLTGPPPSAQAPPSSDQVQKDFQSRLKALEKN
jgi:hypothetical protein